MDDHRGFVFLDEADHRIAVDEVERTVRVGGGVGDEPVGGHHHVGSVALPEHLDDVRSDEAGAPGDHRPHRSAPVQPISATRTGRPSARLFAAASPITSGALPSAPVTGIGVSFSSAVTNAVHWSR